MMHTTIQVRRSRPRSRVSASGAVRSAFGHAAKHLADAANGDLSKRSLHELRIACRRADAALRLCQDTAESRAWSWLRRRLKALRRACNDARDDDVLCQWIRNQRNSSTKMLCRAIKTHRDGLQPRIVALAQRLLKADGFTRRSQKVVQALQAGDRQGRMAHDFGQRLFADVSRFVKSLPAHREDAVALHQLRIVGKRLRYAGELVTSIWPDVDLTELREHLQELQDRLGAIHDQVVGVRRLRQLSKRRSAGAIRPLVEKAQRLADRWQRDFWRWWQSIPIERMLADTTAEVVMLMGQSRQQPRRAATQRRGAAAVKAN